MAFGVTHERTPLGLVAVCSDGFRTKPGTPAVVEAEVLVHLHSVDAEEAAAAMELAHDELKDRVAAHLQAKAEADAALAEEEAKTVAETAAKAGAKAK